MNPSVPPQTTYDAIERLVKKFKTLPTRERNAYNEAETRKSFIVPMFSALEWNFGDAREVAAEEKISRGFVDFSFRIGGVLRFMLETKRIGEDLNKVEFAQQAVDYAYHKDVTWAVLSDFEGLKVLNAEIKESNPLSATFKAFTFEDYLPRLDELWMLSRSAFAEGVLDRAAEKVFKKSIKTPIAQSLFDNLTQWRESLYKNLRAYNRMWTDKDIDDAVQRILDRLIFIRTAEDRDVEGDKLLSLVRVLNDPKNNRINDLMPALSRRFRELDGIYNSQLFANHKRSSTLSSGCTARRRVSSATTLRLSTPTCWAGHTSSTWVMSFLSVSNLKQKRRNANRRGFTIRRRSSSSTSFSKLRWTPLSRHGWRQFSDTISSLGENGFVGAVEAVVVGAVDAVGNGASVVHTSIAH